MARRGLCHPLIDNFQRSKRPDNKAKAEHPCTPGAQERGGGYKCVCLFFLSSLAPGELSQNFRSSKNNLFIYPPPRSCALGVYGCSALALLSGFLDL